MKQPIVIQSFHNKDFFTFDDLFSKYISEDKYKFNLYGLERQETTSYSFKPKREPKKAVTIPTIYVGDRNRIEKSGLCWTIKIPDEETINFVTERKKKIEELTQEIQSHLKERWDEFKPLDLETAKPLSKNQEYIEKVFKQMRGEDKSIKKVK